MALILSIDTALEQASICISENEHVIAVKKNGTQSDHAVWIQQAIREMMEETGQSLSELAAVAVTSGPGSYTGLRVGMATAKGICFALNIPLITESTLYLLAQRVKKEIATHGIYSFPVLMCPMIDARRMEVFTCLYDLDLNELVPPAAMILDENSFSLELRDNIILFCGNGSKKWQNLCMHTNAVFADIAQNVTDLAESAAKKLKKGAFSDLAYVEPAYLKNFYTGKVK